MLLLQWSSRHPQQSSYPQQTGLHPSAWPVGNCCAGLGPKLHWSCSRSVGTGGAEMLCLMLTE